MHYLELLRREYAGTIKMLAIRGAVAGISNAILLAIINSATQSVSSEENPEHSFFLYFVALLLFFITNKYVIKTGTKIVEDVLHQIRERLINKITTASLLTLEKLGRGELYNRITEQMSLISQTANILFNAILSGFVLIFIALYLLIMSFELLIILIGTIIVGALIYLRNIRDIQSRLSDTNEKEIAFFDAINGSLDGFKELKLNKDKRLGMMSETKAISEKLKDGKIEIEYKYSGNQVFSQTFFFLLFGVIVFLIPKFADVTNEAIVMTVTSVLFIIGPVSTLVTVIPYFKKVMFAFDSIYALEKKLDEAAENLTSDKNDTSELEIFEKIDFNKLFFRYNNGNNGHNFEVGPATFSINKGEVFFIVGGNGSGKTTLLKMLTSLFPLQEGSIAVDGKEISNDNTRHYRELFSVIFSDFHLFSKLYALSDEERDTVVSLLESMELSGITHLLKDKFSTLDLSTGQKKRLAMIVSLLEDKPIYIFDEWAADQDPEFTKYFYDTLIPDLKRKGKTVIAVSHDDRYFDRADMVMKMEYGKISEIIKH